MEEKIKEMIKGGKSEGMNCEAIAEKHKVPVEDIKDQVKKGIKIEHEHTPDNDIAAEIARDHLVEHPFYYDLLEDMEKEMEKDYDNKEYGKENRNDEEPASEDEDSQADNAKRDRLKKLFG
jgi:hypothetical protein